MRVYLCMICRHWQFVLWSELTVVALRIEFNLVWMETSLCKTSLVEVDDRAEIEGCEVLRCFSDRHAGKKASKDAQHDLYVHLSKRQRNDISWIQVAFNCTRQWFYNTGNILCTERSLGEICQRVLPCSKTELSDFSNLRLKQTYLHMSKASLKHSSLCHRHSLKSRPIVRSRKEETCTKA